jgi:CBS domain-containing protein
MKTDVPYLRENMWADAAVSFLSERGLRDAPVLDGEGRPVGVLYVDDVETEQSFAEFAGVAEDGGDEFWASALMREHGLGSGFHLDGHRRMRVREVMVPYVPEIPADAAIATAVVVMRDNQLDHVMVVGDDGRAVGTFSREELCDWLVDQTSGARTVEAGSRRRLRDLMRPAISIRRRASLLTARDVLTTHELQEVPVVEAGRVVGVVLEADIYGLISAHRDDDGWMQELLVEDVMKAAPEVRGPDESVESVQALLNGECGCVLIEQNGRLIGIVNARDLDPLAAGGVSQASARSQLSY